MMHFLPALIAGLAAAWATAATWLWREGKTVLKHVPAAVVELLRGPWQPELLRLVAQVAAYANLTKEQRRATALQFVATWLENHGLTLSDAELTTLVELLYSFVHTHQPGAIAPEPFLSGPGVGGQGPGVLGAGARGRGSGVREAKDSGPSRSDSFPDPRPLAPHPWLLS